MGNLGQDAPSVVHTELVVGVALSCQEQCAWPFLFKVGKPTISVIDP